MDSVVISRFKSSITHKCVNGQERVKNWACTSIALLPWKVLNTLDKSWTVHTIKCLPDFSARKMSYKIKKYLTLYSTFNTTETFYQEEIFVFPFKSCLFDADISQ